MKIKIKLWVEDREDNLIYGDGKNEILSCIDELGSLEDISKQMNMPEERIFEHLEIIEANNESEMVLCTKGLKANSQAKYKLTSKAREVLQTYQIFQHDVRRFAKKRFEERFNDT